MRPYLRARRAFGQRARGAGARGFTINPRTHRRRRWVSIPSGSSPVCLCPSALPEAGWFGDGSGGFLFGARGPSRAAAAAGCGRRGLRPPRAVAVAGCGRRGLWPPRAAAVAGCVRRGLRPSRAAAIAGCGRRGLRPPRLDPSPVASRPLARRVSTPRPSRLDPSPVASLPPPSLASLTSPPRSAIFFCTGTEAVSKKRAASE